MGAQNYLLAQKQTLAPASLIVVVLLFLFSVYSVTNAESLQNSEAVDTTQQATLPEERGDTHASDDNSLQLTTGPLASSESEDVSSVNSEVEVVKPIVPIKPVQPTVSAGGSVENSSEVETHQNALAESEEGSSQVTNDSSVRIRLRDRSRSEINGEDIESGNHSLNLTIREGTSTQ